MTTKVIVEEWYPNLVKVGTLLPGEGFRWNKKLYLKLVDGQVVRIKGEGHFSNFESARLDNTALVEPMNVEIKFSPQ
ncbi:MAG: hypothetical protein ACRCTP_02340 [Aeromonas popoffii]|uniref:hypothetical protein n=1 Tax=Aeromonas popoffii TaxID=70856 RepID=UPI003F2AC7CA